MPHPAAFAIQTMGRFGTDILRDLGWGLLVLAALVLSSGCEAPAGGIESWTEQRKNYSSDYIA